MRVLFIQQDHVSPTGPVGKAFADHGYLVETLPVVTQEHFHTPAVHCRFPEPTDYDAIVPMGAPWSVYDHDRIGTWIHDEIAFIRAAHEADVPVLGICFGGQVLAAALGGSVVPSDRAEVGWTELRTSRPELISPGPWFEWHSDRWLLPPGIEAVASTEVCDQAFVAGRSLGLQFHPELTPAMLDGWLGNGGAAHAQELGLDPAQLLAETHARADEAAELAAQLVTRFLGQVASAPARTAGALG